MDTLEGKVAFVTGAASGIGFGIATALAQAGAKVMLCDIDRDGLAQSVATLRATNADVDSVFADVSVRADLATAAEATVAGYGRVDVLINNAGVAGGGGYGRWRELSWEWTLGVNLMAVIHGVDIFGPLIEAHGEGGHIVNTASIAGLISGRGSPYHVSKYGVIGLSEGLRHELAPLNIGVSVLCPGFVRTKILDSARNLPDRFHDAFPDRADAANDVPAEFLREIAARLAAGVDPLYVGELVREGIEGNWDYIFTDTEFEPDIRARFAAIGAAFDRIRDRDPR